MKITAIFDIIPESLYAVQFDGENQNEFDLMSKEKVKEKLANDSRKDSNWMEEAKWRQANAEWLELSGAIALKILSFLRENKITQKELAKELGWSPQYLNKVVKGSENLTLDTICKIQIAIGVPLIKVPHSETRTAQI